MNSTSSPPPPPRLGKYDVIAKLGEGGMAQVYLACARGPAGFNKLVVIKRLRAKLAEQEYVEMFFDEARLSARLNHPNIVQINEVSEEGPEHFMVMEYLEGQALQSVLRRANLGEVHVQRLMIHALSQALLGLHAAHVQKDFDGSPLGIVHRDVSPHNVFVTYDGQVKVVDFGIAKVSRPREETAAGVLKGKLHYLAPEQVNRSGQDHRVDVFSAGIMLYEIAARRRFWAGRKLNGSSAEVGILAALLREDLETSPKLVEPAVDDALDAICRRALAYAKEDRYPTAYDFHLDLQKYLASVGAPPTQAELGSMVSELFTSERAAITATIEAQLRELSTRNGTSPSATAPISLPQLTSSLTPSTHAAQFVPVPPPPRRGAKFAVLLVALAALAGGAFVALRTRGHDTATVEPRANSTASEPSAPLAPTGSSETSALVLPVKSSVTSVPSSATPTRVKWTPPPPTASVPLTASIATPAGNASVVPPPPVSAQAPATDCAVPFTIDSSGIKHPKPNCN